MAPIEHPINPRIPIETTGHEEGFLHYIAREGRIALRWTIGACLIAIVVLMVSPLWMAAVLPAILLLVAYILLLAATEVERRSDSQAHQDLERRETAVGFDVIDDHAEDDQFAPDQAHIIRRESRTGIIIVASIMAVAVLIAAVFLDARILAIGALVVFAYMLLIAAPLWLGWFNDDIEDETRRLQDAEPPA